MKEILLSLLALLLAGSVFGSVTTQEDKTEENKDITVEENQQIDFPEGASFTDKLYSLMPENENYMFSPFSVKSALAIAANGAQGETKDEILEAVGIEDLDAFNKTMSETIDKYSATDLLRFDISNSVWLNTDKADFDFSKSFTDTITQYYNGDSGKVNDKNAVSEINDWVKEKTNGKIPSIISSPDFEAALINAIYFKAKWENEFDNELTKPDIFTSRDGKETEIQFMNATRKYNYAEKDGVQVLELPYKTRGTTGSPYEYNEKSMIQLDNTSVSMYILLSDNDIGSPEELVSGLCENGLFTKRKVNLSLPKFKIEYSAELSPALKTLGIKSAFSDADFGKMFDKETDTAISNVLHKTYIEVDEEGTEAAAVTAILMAGSAMPQPEEIIDFKADKPFTFLIRDNISGETFFIGEYAYAN